LSAPIELGDGRWVLFEPPVDVDELWREWLGSLLSDNIAKSKLWLWAASPSAKPDVLDDEDEKLSQKVYYLRDGLLLIGYFRYKSAYELNGANNRGSVDVRQIGELVTYFPLPNDRGIMIDRTVLEQAANLSLGLESIFAVKNSYERLCRGLDALREAWKAGRGEYRMHQYVRSLEALIKPGIWKTKRQFIERCQTFAKKSNIAEQVLSESYDIRSQTEHLHGWEAALMKSYPSADVERIAELRLRQIDALTRDAYRRIFSSDDLKKIFVDDTSIEKFWQEPEDVRTKRWGPGIDLGSVT
jgi:hypothetical protein